MENLIKNVLLVIVFGIIGITVIYVSYISKKWKNFNKYLKVGDVVDYYISGDRCKFKVSGLGNIYCKIKDESGNEIKVLRTDIYPNFWTNYAPKSYIE